MAIQLRQEKDITYKSSIGIDQETAAALVPELDGHLASCFTLFHQYQKHCWLVRGPQYRDLTNFIREAYGEVHRHIDMIAERIIALGGVPTCHPVEQNMLSYLSHESEGTFPLRTMLELDREYEAEIAKNLRNTIRAADELGDPGTSHLLKEILFDIESRANHLDNFIGCDNLQDGIKD